MVDEEIKVKAYFIDVVAPVVLTFIIAGYTGLGFLIYIAFIYVFIKDTKNISIASKILKIKIIHFKTKEECTFFQSIIRNLPLFFIPIVEGIVLQARQDDRRLGDIMAKTKVVINK